MLRTTRLRITFVVILLMVFLDILMGRSLFLLRSENEFSNTVVTSLLVTTSTNATVIRVIDGDTIVARMDQIPQENVKVRMLGVNTPESVDPRRPVQCFGREASMFVERLLEGQRVRIDPDMQADEQDKYGRLLRNVILSDGTDVNAKLVREGYAYAYVSFPMNSRRRNDLRRWEREARQSNSGLWNPKVCDGKNRKL